MNGYKRWLLACLLPTMLALFAPGCSGVEEGRVGQSASNLVTCIDLQESATSLPDTYVTLSQPSSNFGSSASLETGSGRVAYLAYDLSAVPSGAAVTQATLTLRHTLGAADSLQVQAVSAAWSESSVTFATRPPGSGNILTAPFTAAPSTASIDVTPLVSNLPLGVTLRTTGLARFGSGEASVATDRPSLTVCYDLPTCSDGLQNGEETGIDCGGSLCPACCVPMVETCNGVDDNCDGVVDEGCGCAPGSVEACYAGPSGSVDVGVCMAGVRTCDALGVSYGPCVGEVVPGYEDCSLPSDEDCDGQAPLCTGTTVWVGHWGSTQDDRTEGVAVDAAGNMYAVGWFQGTVDFGGTTLVSAGARDMYIMKRAADGALLWVKGFGSTGLDVAWALGVNPAGDVVVAGTFQGTVDFGGGPRIGASTSTYDVVVARYDTQGNHVFSQTWGSSFDDYAFGAAFTSDGNVVVVGTFFASISVGGVPLVSSGNRDIFVAKLDSVGATVWAKKVGGTDVDYAYGVGASPAGLIAVAGSATGSVDFGAGALPGPGLTDAYVMVLDAAGQLMWVYRTGDSNAQDAFSAAFAPNGDVVAAGDFTGSVSLGSTLTTSTSQFDAWVARFSSNGTPLWGKRIGAPGTQDAARGVAVDGAGHVVVTGLFSSSADLGGGPLTSAGSADVFVGKYDAAGNHLWSHRYGDATTQYAYFAATDDKANVYIAGMFQGTTDFGLGPVTSNGSNDGFLLKLGELVPSCQDGLQNQGEGGVDCGGPCAPCAGGCTGGCGSHVFSKKYGDDAHIQGGEAVAADSQGNLYFSGSYTGTMDLGGGVILTSLSPTIYDAYLIKTTSLGAVVWAKSFGNGFFPQFAYGVAVDASDAVIVTGIVRGLVNFGGGTRQGLNQDVFVAKYTSSGSHVYSKVFGDANPQQMGLVLVADAASNVYVGCQIQGTVNFGGGVLTSAGNLDAAVVKLDAAGNHLWSRMFGGTGKDEVNQLALNPAQDRLIVAGTHSGTFDVGGGPLSTPAGVAQGYFVIYDAQGNAVDSRGFAAGAALDQASSVEGAMFDSSGNIVVVGPFDGQLDLGGGALLATPFGTASFVAKLDPAGNHLFSQARQTYLVRLAVSPEDDLLVASFDSGAGSPNDLGGGALPAGGAVGKYDQDGTFIWGFSLGGGNPNGLGVDSQGHMLLTGDITSVVDLGGGPLTLSPPSLQGVYVGSLLY